MNDKELWLTIQAAKQELKLLVKRRTKEIIYFNHRGYENSELLDVIFTRLYGNLIDTITSCRRRLKPIPVKGFWDSRLSSANDILREMSYHHNRNNYRYLSTASLQTVLKPFLKESFSWRLLGTRHQLISKNKYVVGANFLHTVSDIRIYRVKFTSPPFKKCERGYLATNKTTFSLCKTHSSAYNGVKRNTAAKVAKALTETNN